MGRTLRMTDPEHSPLSLPQFVPPLTPEAQACNAVTWAGVTPGDVH